MDLDRLQELLADERRHLADGRDTHFHIVVSTDNKNEWEFARFISSPPYRDLVSAERDAQDPRLVAKVGTFEVNILECHRACPRSALGRFGWEDDQPEPYHWWNGRGWGFG